MTVLDVNLLLYAYNPGLPQQPAAAAFLEGLFNGLDPVGLPWSTLWAFLRISTDHRIPIYRRTPDDVFSRVREWLSLPTVHLVHPGPKHVAILQQLVVENEAIGPLLSDAALAAIAIEHGATLASTDRDFGRFPGLRWINPLAQA